MNLIPLTPWMQAIGWTLLHSLWQWTLLALLWLGLSRVLHQATAARRYQWLLGILLLGCLSSGLTGWLIYQAESVAVSLTDLPSDPAAFLPFTDESPAADVFSWENIRVLLSPILPYLTGLWLLGVAMMSLRMGIGYSYLQRLKHRQVTAIPDYWMQQSTRLSQLLGIRRSVQVLESALISGPMTLGHLKPVILLPLGMLSGMSPDHIEALLAHELAHIRRADYLVNLIQSLIEILFFFHPAVWWISREIRQEREACCDDLAVAICGDAFVYASALTRVMALRSTFQPQLSMNATGLNSHFSRRIQRLLGVPRTSPLSGKTVFISLIALLASLSFGLQVLAQSKVTPPAGEEVHEWEFTSEMGPREVKQVMADIHRVNSNFFLREVNFDAQNQLNHLIICEERTPGMVTCLEVKDIERLHFAWRPEEAQPAKFTLHGGEMIVHPAEATPPAQAPTPDETAPLIVIDGVPSPPEAFEKIKANPERIESINVLKGEAAMDAYQEAGVNGVVEIRLKALPEEKEQAGEQPVKLRSTSGKIQPQPLFVIDGVRHTSEAFEQLNLNPEQIDRIEVLKGEAAVDAYQEAGKNGVVQIFLKRLPEEPGAEPNVGSSRTLPDSQHEIDGLQPASEVRPLMNPEPEPIEQIDVIPSAGGEQTIRIRSAPGKGPDPLYVIDGVRRMQFDLDPGQIERINVLKGEAALSGYGEAGKNGVVIITTKAGNKEREAPLPVRDFSLLASPNGFADQTHISFSLPEALETQVEVLDINGKVVQLLQKGLLQAGAHRFVLAGETLVPGTYLILLKTPNGQQTQRVVYQP